MQVTSDDHPALSKSSSVLRSESVDSPSSSEESLSDADDLVILNPKKRHRAVERSGRSEKIQRLEAEIEEIKSLRPKTIPFSCKTCILLLHHSPAWRLPRLQSKKKIEDQL